MPYTLARDSSLFIKAKFPFSACHVCLEESCSISECSFFCRVFETLQLFLYVFQLVAVFDEVHAGRTASPSESMSNGYSSSASPEPLPYFPHLDYKEPIRGEIEVNEAVLKAST